MSNSSILRVIDANVDRSLEGLRVLEDIARFILDDATLSAQLRDLRHRIARSVAPLDSSLLASRRAESDVGAAGGLPEASRADLAQLARANARRTEEALRVLEEFARLQELPQPLDMAPIKAARFATYALEQRLTGALDRRSRAERVAGLYVILDPTATRGRDEVEIAEMALAGGARVIQYRDKLREKGLQLPVLTRLRALCDRHNALLIVNDHADLAVACGADGVHFGQKDLPVAAGRALLDPDQIIGISCATVDEARAADAGGADYIAVGAMFPTSSKSDTRPAGVSTLRQVRALTNRPLVAIGGISLENIGEVIAAGAGSVAVISAVLGAADPRKAAEDMAGRLARADGGG